MGIINIASVTNDNIIISWRERCAWASVGSKAGVIA